MDFLPPATRSFGTAATTRWMQVTRQSPVWHRSLQSRVSRDCGSCSSEGLSEGFDGGVKEIGRSFRFTSAISAHLEEKKRPPGVSFGDGIAFAPISQNSDGARSLSLYRSVAASGSIRLRLAGANEELRRYDCRERHPHSGSVAVCDRFG
jgi:hypothetical protein